MAAAAPSSSSSSPSASARRPLISLHRHAREQKEGYPKRVEVPDERVPWEQEWADYVPTDFTADRVKQRSKDPSDPRSLPDLSHRFSYSSSPLRLSPSSGRPLNPYGRTGLAGRGRLYNWGPNHAADPLISRVAQTKGGGAAASAEEEAAAAELEVVVIRRGDSGLWALPGGMIDPGEEPWQTARREFEEEAVAVAGERTEQQQREVEQLLAQVFDRKQERIVYCGYIDDPRNTDNAWLESVCLHYPVSPSLSAALTPLLQAGSDAKEVKWLRASDEEEDFRQLYGSHRPMILKAVQQWREEQQKQQNNKNEENKQADTAKL